MRLAPRIVVLALLLCAPVSAHAAPGDSLPPARLDVSAGTPSGRYSHSAVMDPIRSRMVMHGGYVDAAFNDQWELTLDGAAEWFLIPAGATATPARSAYVGVLDTARDRMLMFGGWDNSSRRNDTWALSLGDNEQWSLLTTAGVHPSQRTLMCGIYDPVRDRLIVFGGYEDHAYLNDVWALSLSGTPTWTLITPTGTPPTRRRESSAIYDPIRDRMIVYGGTDGGFYDEVWELRLGGVPAWARLTPAGPSPSPRSGHSAVYDPTRDLMWVFGGRTASGEVQDLWTLGLSGAMQWQSQTTNGTRPVSRAYHSAVMDAARDRMIVFAGYTGTFPNDTWFLQLTGVPTWYPMGSEPHGPPTKPDPRFDQPPVVSATTIELGQSLTVSVSVRNQGTASDDGIISMSFPSMTDPADGQWVESSASGDTPGYVELPAGSPMLAVGCQPMTALALAVEYRDDAWEGLGAEQNALSVTVRPKAAGTFYVYVRSTMRKAGTTCEYENGTPSGPGDEVTDQQGWTVRRLAVTVVDSPGPVFSSSIAVSASTIEIGQTFTISAAVVNVGATSDDGRIVFSFPGMTDPADAQWVSSLSSGDDPGYREQPAGSALTGASCQPITASYLMVEYADGDWRGFSAETNTMVVTVQPRTVGTFTFDVRSTMRKSGTACENLNGLPAGGTAAADQQGWAVRRFSVTVVDAPAPSFTSLAQGATSITIGQWFSITASVTNAGAASDDGRIAISFPGMTDPADAQWVSSTSAGDSPGYLEHPAGSALTDASCQPITASYLMVEYADGDWKSLGTETNTLVMTVQPKAGGTFTFDVRSTMRKSGTACELINAVPAGGTAAVDQQGWAVKRFSVTVLDAPVPTFNGNVQLSTSSIEIGQTFTVTATVYNSGAPSDDGRIAISFPGMSDPADAQWVSNSSTDDAPGYLEYPAGSTLTDASCQPLTASSLMVEYADGDWRGLTTELNTLHLTVRPRAPGTFYLYVRATMHKSGTTCDFTNALPPNGEGGFFDQTGQPVRRFAVTVTNPPPAPRSSTPASSP